MTAEAEGRPALLVIFGAGASFDSIPPNAPSGDSAWRPPLAKDLFDYRVEYAAIAERWRCVPTVAHLRNVAQRDEPIEQELGRLQEDAKQDPRLFRQLVALRCYLQDLLWESSQKWIGGSYSDTNYLRLADRLETWRYRLGAEVAYVTFNYDLLLDSALADVSIPGLPHRERRRTTPTEIDTYIGNPESRLFKVHGSVNWARGVTNNPTRYGSVAGDQRRFVIQHSDDLQISDEFVVCPKPGAAPEKSRFVLHFPAIAIPTERKSVFECPTAHVDALKSLLPRVRWLLVIGWRGQEEHFIDSLGDALRGDRDISAHVVSASMAGAKQTSSALLRATIGSRVNMKLFDGGFTKYVASVQDRQLLAAATS